MTQPSNGDQAPRPGAEPAYTPAVDPFHTGPPPWGPPAAAIMRLSDRIVVLNSGEKLAEGNPSEIVGNPQVVEAYLGPEQ